MNKYCQGIDCAWCNEKEPCIYKIANKLHNTLEDIREICCQQNITIAGGEKSPKDEWIELYINTTGEIIAKINEVIGAE